MRKRLKLSPSKLKELYKEVLMRDKYACQKDPTQELIDRGFDVHSVDIKGNWIEIDTHEDYQNALKTIK